MSCDWEGNRRSGVALAMRHRLTWFIHLWAQGVSKGDEHPTNAPHVVWYSLPFCHEKLISKCSDTARVNDGSHSFTCRPFIHQWTVLPAFISQPQSITAFWLVLIFRLAEGRRLSWPEWLVTNWDAWFTRPQTVTHPSINQARRRVTSLIERLTRYHLAKSPSRSHYKSKRCRTFHKVVWRHV